MKMSLALGVMAAMRLAVYGKHAVTGQASKHSHCSPYQDGLSGGK